MRLLPLLIALLDEVERLRLDAGQLDAHLAAATREVERLTKGQEGLAAAWTAALADNDEAREQLGKAEAMKEREYEKLRDQLAAMTKARDEACDLADGLAAHHGSRAQWLLHLDRIAELRKVGQPK